MSDTDDYSQKKSKKKKDDEESEGEDVDQPDSDEEEVASENEDDRNFVVGDDEVEEEGEDGESKHRKKKRHRKRVEADLDEDDYEMIEQNMGIKLRREDDERRSRFKRLKRKKELDEERPTDSSQNLERLFEEEERNRNEMRKQKQKEKHERSLKLGSDDSSDIEDIPEDSGDEIDGFIDDDEVEGEKPVRKSRVDVEFEDMEYHHSQEWNSLFGGDILPLQPDDETDEEEEINNIEPSKLEENYVTSKDREIQHADIPERMYHRAINRKIEEGELEEERDWIRDHADFKKEDNITKGKLSASILHVLKFLREELLEVPFLQEQRQDYFKDVLILEDLWKIYDLDEKWKSFWEKKKSIQELQSILEMENIVDDYLNSCILSSETEEELNDVYFYIKRHYGHKIAQFSEERKKEFKNRDVYILYVESSIDKLAEKGFGITSRQFGENIELLRNKHEPTSPKMLPINFAEGFFCENYDSSSRKLSAAKECMVLAIAADPKVRKSVRASYQKEATITIRPTNKGKTEINEYHEYKHFKYILRQPVSADKLKPQEFLQMVKAEKEGFINIIFSSLLEEKYGEELRSFFLDDATDEFANAWNLERRAILDRVLKVHFDPHFQRELKSKLVIDAIRSVADECSKIMQQKLMVGPYQHTRLNDPTEKPKVFSITWGRIENQATFGCVLNGVGEVVDYIRLEHIRDDKSQKYLEDKSQLENFLRSHQPNVIVIGASDLTSRTLYRLVENAARASIQKESQLTITYMSEDVAILYQSSERARQEFPDYPELLRCAISLGRRLIDPLDEISALCNTRNDILCLKLHPLQEMVPETLLLERIHRSFMNVVSRTGVDINLMVNYPHKKHTLQFVCGLGERKADHIYKLIFDEGQLETRQDLIIKHKLGKTTYFNCSSFFKIYTLNTRKKKGGQVHDALDRTRIHPKNYNYARRMAAAAIDKEQDKIGAESNPSIYVEELWSLEKSKASKALDEIFLDEFVKGLQSSNPGQLFHDTIVSIKLELREPYFERRMEFSPPSDLEVFYMLTGETSHTLDTGHTIPVTIIDDKSARLDCGIEGKVREPNRNRTNPAKGDTLMANILEINYKNFEVDLSFHEDDLKEKNLSKYYDYETEEKDLKEKEEKQKKKVTKITRQINHPQFQNFSHEEAVNFLNDKDIGEVIIRPSSKGYSTLNMIWKSGPDNFQNIEIKEESKLNNQSIGKVLKIEVDHFKDTYEDLDEIIARVIEPMAERAKKLCSHPKFLNTGERELRNYIIRERENNPRFNPYFFCRSEKFLGRFSLGFWTGANVRFELVSIKPDGFYFRGESFRSVNDVVASFKNNPQGRPIRK